MEVAVRCAFQLGGAHVRSSKRSGHIIQSEYSHHLLSYLSSNPLIRSLIYVIIQLYANQKKKKKKKVRP